MTYSTSFMLRHRVVPLGRRGSAFTVAVEEPPGTRLRRVLESYHGSRVDFKTTERNRLTIMLQQRIAMDARNGEDTTAVAVSELPPGKRRHVRTDRAEEYLGGTGLLNALLNDAVDRRATDIHLESFRGHGEVRYRVDGRLITPDAHRISPAAFASLAARAKVLASVNATERRRPQDGGFSAITVHGPIDVRLASTPTVEGEALVLRLFQRYQDEFTLGRLGMSTAAVLAVRDRLRKRVGMITVLGPTGSGKTTTLHALLRELNDRATKIVAIEDPVEYRVPQVQQIQVNEGAGLTMARALRHVLRQDPDVIMVGEIRDEATAALALRAALTGHLLLSTVHAANPSGARRRLRNLGVPRDLLHSLDPLFIVQRLVRRRCACTIGGSRGCRECRGSGFCGRTGVFALDSSRALISMRDEAEHLLREGTTTAEEVAWALLQCDA